MKNAFKMIAVFALLNTANGFAQTRSSASADCFATIVAIGDTAKLASVSNGVEKRVPIQVVAPSMDARQYTMHAKSSFVQMGLFGGRRKYRRSSI